MHPRSQNLYSCVKVPKLFKVAHPRSQTRHKSSQHRRGIPPWRKYSKKSFTSHVPSLSFSNISRARSRGMRARLPRLHSVDRAGEARRPAQWWPRGRGCLAGTAADLWAPGASWLHG